MKTMDEKVCGTCKWHRKDVESFNPSWYCNNPDGDYYSDYTEYNDECSDWEERQ